jgi:hypothetical protein
VLRAVLLLVLCSLVAFSGGLGYVGWRLYYGVPLRVTVMPGEVLIDTRTFGEYRTAISRLRLIDDQSGAIVWEAMSMAADGTSGVSTFTLRAGLNESPERLAKEFRTTIPATEKFTIQSGRRYKIRVWGSTTRHRNTRTFVAPDNAGKLGATHNKALKLPARSVTALAFARSAPARPAA